MSYCPGVSLPIFWGQSPSWQRLGCGWWWSTPFRRISLCNAPGWKAQTLDLGSLPGRWAPRTGPRKWLGITPIYKLLILGHEWKGSSNPMLRLRGWKWSPWLLSTEPSTRMGPNVSGCPARFQPPEGMGSFTQILAVLDVYLESETSIYKWLFQLDDSKPLHGKQWKWLFNQTSILNWLFGVPGSYDRSLVHNLLKTMVLVFGRLW